MHSSERVRCNEPLAFLNRLEDVHDELDMEAMVLHVASRRRVRHMIQLLSPIHVRKCSIKEAEAASDYHPDMGRPGLGARWSAGMPITAFKEDQ